MSKHRPPGRNEQTLPIRPKNGCLSSLYEPEIQGSQNLDGRTGFLSGAPGAHDACAERMHRILAPSHTLVNRMIESGITPTRIRYWPFGLDTRSIREKKNLQKSLSYPLRFGYTGTISPQKGIETMLKSFEILPADRAEKVRLFVYGSFDRTPAIHRRVIRWMKRCAHRPVSFEGYYAQHQLPEILENLDVVICPSIWYENRPLSIIESFAAGIPVIASRLGGMRELVEDTGAGWTFPPGDTKLWHRLSNQ